MSHSSTVWPEKVGPWSTVWIDVLPPLLVAKRMLRRFVQRRLPPAATSSFRASSRGLVRSRCSLGRRLMAPVPLGRDGRPRCGWRSRGTERGPAYGSGRRGPLSRSQEAAIACRAAKPICRGSLPCTRAAWATLLRIRLYPSHAVQISLRTISGLLHRRWSMASDCFKRADRAQCANHNTS